MLPLNIVLFMPGNLEAAREIGYSYKDPWEEESYIFEVKNLILFVIQCFNSYV